MHATIIELDALADTVRPTTQNDDLAPVCGRSLALVLVGGVHIGRVGGELCRAGVHALVDWPHIKLMTQLAHFTFGCVQQEGQTPVRESDRKSTRLNSSH